MPIYCAMEAVAEHAARPETGSQLDNRRIAAGAIDLAVVLMAGLLLRTLTGGFGMAAAALTVGWGLYYYFALEWTSGQTLGKRVMRLRVARADGDAPGIREAAVRTVLRVVDGIGFYVVGLAAMLATGERRQRLGDLAAGTVVTTSDTVSDESAPPAEEPAAAPIPAPAPPAPAAATPTPVAAPASAEEAVPVPAPAPVEAPARVEAPAPVEEHAPVEAPTPVEAPARVEEPAPAPVAEEPTPAAETSLSLLQPEQPEEETADEVEVKPMEIVSPLELLMAESEKKDAGDAGQQHPGDTGQSA